MASMASLLVTLPPSLAFLVSNFNSLVNIKLDGDNYLLWKFRVENVLDANGFLGYVDGSVSKPHAEISNDKGEMIPNPEYAMWKLIDTQILSCLTSSLSQKTLPYVSGLHHSSQVWISLRNRYYAVSRTHIRELKDQLKFIKKSATVLAFLDVMGEFLEKLFKKLKVDGGTLEHKEFLTLCGIDKFCGSLKNAMEARGDNDLTYGEILTMLRREGRDLIKDDDSSIEESVLVATHPTFGHGRASTSNKSSMGQSSQMNQAQSQFKSRRNIVQSYFNFPTNQAQSQFDSRMNQVSASNMLDATRNRFRIRQGEEEDLSEGLSQLLATIDSDSSMASFFRSMIVQHWP